MDLVLDRESLLKLDFRNEKLTFVSLKFIGTRFPSKCLIDTGASISLIHTSVVEKLIALGVLVRFQPCNISLTVGDGFSFEIKTKVELDFIIEGLKYRYILQ